MNALLSVALVTQTDSSVDISSVSRMKDIAFLNYLKYRYC